MKNVKTTKTLRLALTPKLHCDHASFDCIQKLQMLIGRQDIVVKFIFNKREQGWIKFDIYHNSIIHLTQRNHLNIRQ